MAVQRYSQIMVVDTQSSLPTAIKGDFAYAVDTGLAFTFDGTYWNPSSKVQVKKTSTVVNTKNTGTTLLYTLENSSLNFYPTQIVPRASSITAVTGSPTLSVGSNPTSYNNIASASALTTVLSTLSVGTGVPQTANYSPALAGGTGIYANVTIAAIATAYSVIYDILGFYDT